MKVFRCMPILLGMVLLIVTVYSALNFSEELPKFETISTPTTISSVKPRTCAKLYEYNKIQKKKTRKQLTALLHSVGTISTYRLFKDSKGKFRLVYTVRYRRCGYTMKKGYFAVGFKEDPARETKAGVVMVSVRKWKVPD